MHCAKALPTRVYVRAERYFAVFPLHIFVHVAVFLSRLKVLPSALSTFFASFDRGIDRLTSINVVNCATGSGGLTFGRGYLCSSGVVVGHCGLRQRQAQQEQRDEYCFSHGSP